MGLFEAIFGKSAPKDDTAPKQAYYLSDDDSKTYGNIDYMRSNKTVRRTFAKKKGQTEHMESIRQISSLKSANLDSNPVQGQASYGLSDSTGSSPSYSGTSSTPSSSSAASTPRRKPASGDMDMFRNMAKSIRK